MQNTITGLFSVNYDGKRQLICQASCTVSLEKYLKGNLLHENAFWRMISQMIDVAIEVENSGLYTAHLLLQKDALFIQEDTLEMFFIYQPIVSTKLSENLFALIHDIVYQEIKKKAGCSRHT